MGKTDVRAAGELAERHPGVSYQAFDLWKPDQTRMREMLAEAGRAVRGGCVVCSYPLTGWDVRRAELSLHEPGRARRQERADDAAVVDRDGTMLVRGGRAHSAAHWRAISFSEHGVRHLLLAEPSSRGGPGSERSGRELRALGACVTVVALTSRREDQVAGMLAELPRRPLRGGGHPAGVLEDGVLETMSHQPWTVFVAKAQPAWNLHLPRSEAITSPRS